MSIWDTIKSSLEDGLEILSEKGADFSQVTKLKWERRTIQKEIVAALRELGILFFSLKSAAEKSSLADRSKELLSRIDKLEEELSGKEEEILNLTSRMDGKHVRGLRRDLELGDGSIEQVVLAEGASLVGQKLMDIKLPAEVLVGTIVRQGEVIIPDGKTVLRAGDRVTLLGKKDDVKKIIQKLE